MGFSSQKKKKKRNEPVKIKEIGPLMAENCDSSYQFEIIHITGSIGMIVQRVWKMLEEISIFTREKKEVKNQASEVNERSEKNDWGNFHIHEGKQRS